MAEGHSFHRCNNVILICYSWAYDRFEQAINRVHRLNSLWDVSVYPIICDGSIDRKLEAMIQEKGDAAELVLDGHLLGEHQSEVNLAELLHVAQQEFNGPGAARTIDEASLEADWPKLRLLLGRAVQTWSTGGASVPASRSTGPVETPAPSEVRSQESEIRKGRAPCVPSRGELFKLEATTASRPREPSNAFAQMPLWKQRFLPSRGSVPRK